MANLRKIRVLIVDDSVVFRETLSKELSNDLSIDIIGTAMDSFDAFEKIKLLKPDVVTLDVEMPRMNGIDFLKKLMPEHPLPVVVVSSLPLNALDALDAGAVDFVRKPQFSSAFDMMAFINELTVKIKIASLAHLKLTKPSMNLPVSHNLTLNNVNNTVIAIGASTGGTDAILAVVKNLPVFTPGIVIVQHMPPVFTNMYAERLNKICKMQVKEAKNGDRVEKGHILIAAGDTHMTVAKDTKGYYVKCAPGEKVSGHCPSVDVLFDSVATIVGKRALGVILTGMGADGAKGLLKMRQSGAYTIGQDKESCVVYGMPMMANKCGAVMKELPLSRISSDMIEYLNTMK